MDIVEDIRQNVTLREYDLLHTKYTKYPGSYPDHDDSFDLELIKQSLKIKIIELGPESMTFDMIGTAPAIANAIRRILISEVPTMAIEKVFMENNTSQIHDEVFAHRLGLVPLKADPRLFEYRKPETEPSESDTLKFKLQVQCSANLGIKKEPGTTQDANTNSTVYSSAIKWIPIGDQAAHFKAEDVGPIHPDIILNQLRPGMEIDLNMDAVKGIGRDHAKFSPVATASYRLHPRIMLTKPVEGDDADRLATYFSPGVIEVVEGKGKRTKAVVANERADTCSRNVFRDDKLKDSVKLSLDREYFIFLVESTGALPPDTLVEEALLVLMGKCTKLLGELKNMNKKGHKK